MRLGLVISSIGEVVCALSASTQLVHPKPWRVEMPFVTFTVRRGLSAADKSSLSEAMLEAQVAAGYHRADRFHRFLEVDRDDLLVDPRFPDYATDRSGGFRSLVGLSVGRSIHQQHSKKKDQIQHRKHEQATSGPPFLVVAPTYLPCEKNHDRSKYRRSRAIDG